METINGCRKTKLKNFKNVLTFVENFGILGVWRSIMSDIVATVGNPLTEYKIDPEIFEVATEYVKHLNIEDTAKALDLRRDQVATILEKKEVKNILNVINCKV